MKKYLHSHSLRAFFLTISLLTLLVPALSWGEEDEDAAELFDAWQEQVATISRVAKPLSQIAENITVITAADIKAMNAHTLADILDTVPGVQIEHNGGPGVAPYIYLHSKDFRNVQVLLDGVAISSLDSLFPDTTSIPAMIIERVEIVKGASSTAWGQALGGVINVITKSPDKRPLGGSATASIGKNTTADTRAEVSGSDGRLGYYFSGGYLGSNGLLPGRQVYSNQAYTKLVYDLPGKGQLWGTFNYHGVDSGTRYVPGDIDLREVHNNHTEAASLGFRYQLNDRLELELTGRHFALDAKSTYTNISDGLIWKYLNQDDPAAAVKTAIGKDRTSGASVKLVWRGDTNLLVAGSDYNHLESSSNTSTGAYNYSPYTKIADRGSLYLNDTLTIGPVSLNPGVRLDHTQTHGDNFSATMGATWQLTDNTLLRAYTGLGNGLPELDVNTTPLSRIWNAQIGAESSVIPYLWVKGSLFRNEIWNISDGLNQYSDITERRIALGTELEIRTKPIYNTFLSSGYTFTDTTRTSDGSQVQPDTARHTLQVAVRYDDKTFRGWLNGRHISWNSPAEYNARDHGLIWDLHLGATLLKKENSSLEVFFSGHNLFDTAYYYRDIFPTTGRWFEGGMRVNF